MTSYMAVMYLSVGGKIYNGDPIAERDIVARKTLVSPYEALTQSSQKTAQPVPVTPS